MQKQQSQDQSVFPWLRALYSLHSRGILMKEGQAHWQDQGANGLKKAEGNSHPNDKEAHSLNSQRSLIKYP